MGKNHPHFVCYIIEDQYACQYVHDKRSYLVEFRSDSVVIEWPSFPYGYGYPKE